VLRLYELLQTELWLRARREAPAVATVSTDAIPVAVS
jgi:hypothetical protein